MKNNTKSTKYVCTSHIIHIKFYQVCLIILNVSKSTGKMANSVDPDQTAPLGAVWSGSTLFAQPSLSEYLE